jgi:hypothetical protein
MSNWADFRMEERLAKIHSTGYWRVNIRPTKFESERIPSLAKCRDILQTSIVQLRGWDYPHLDNTETANGQDWVESGCDFLSHIEYWRLYQSGQFVHQFACIEDHEASSAHIRGLEVISTLYTVTEIFEFAGRLAIRGVFSPEAEMSITLAGMEGRKLFLWSPERSLNRLYVCCIPEIAFSKTFTEAEISARASELALDTTVWIFERFNWIEVPRQVLAEDQKRFLERRL